VQVVTRRGQSCKKQDLTPSAAGLFADRGRLAPVRASGPAAPIVSGAPLELEARVQTLGQRPERVGRLAKQSVLPLQVLNLFLTMSKRRLYVFVILFSHPSPFPQQRPASLVRAPGPSRAEQEPGQKRTLMCAIARDGGPAGSWS
jgi:hypothetical protein